MSAIQKQLAAATEVEPSKRRDETVTSQEYMKRLALAVGDLSDKEWEDLSTEAQDWYNSAADSIEAKKDIPEFPDLPKADAPATSRRRGAAQQEVEEYKPKKGDVVTVTTSRDKVYTGTIVELDDEGLVLDVDGQDVELDHAKIKTVMAVGGAKSEPAADPETPKDPQVGDTVQVVTKRGKTIMGKITELSDDEMILEDAAGEVHELSKDRLTSVEIKAQGKPSRGGSVEEKRPAKGAVEKKDKPEKAVSATLRMRQLLVSDLSMKKDEIAKSLTKEGFEFKQATLDLIYSDSHKLIELLKDAGHIKA